MNQALELSERVAIVTGASKGIGRGIALGLARAGCHVAVGYSSDVDGAADVAGCIQDLGRRSIALHCDISDVSSIKALFAQAEQALGHPDIVVANAGIELIDVPFTAYTESQYDRVFDINTKGTFFTLQEAAARVRDGGRIIVICSNTTVLSLPGFAVYGASKLAPKFFVEVLAKEIGQRHVTVNSLSPGVTRSAGVFTSIPDSNPYLQQMIAATPLGRLGRPEDIANAVVLLASDKAAFITGHHLAVDGGAAL
jgi:3-oxoacyl-[acyl-carrier protein] reductase